MSHLRTDFHRKRLLLQFKSEESPTPCDRNISITSAGLSPVTDLVLNLSGTSLGTPRPRRLSLSSIGSDVESPGVFKHSFSNDLVSSPMVSSPAVCDTPVENRILKDVLNVTSNSSNSSRPQPSLRHVALNAFSLNYDKKYTTISKNKENVSQLGNPKLEDRQSSNSPEKLTSPSKFFSGKPLVSSPKQHQHQHQAEIDDFDPNSQDSGYGAYVSEKDESKGRFRFAEPFGCAPRKHHIEPSPNKENALPVPTVNVTSPKPERAAKSNLFRRFSSGNESLDDELLDGFDQEKHDEDTQLPQGISFLLSGPIVQHQNSSNQPSASSKPEEKLKTSVSSFRRCLSLTENVTPVSSRARSCLFKSSETRAVCSSFGSPLLEESSPSQFRSFKRPDPPCGPLSPIQNKRRKSTSLEGIGDKGESGFLFRHSLEKKPTPKLQRSYSETEATIKRAVLISTQEPHLIGDFSKPYMLPLMDGRHQDLKSISCHTLAALMRGDFEDEISSFTVVDCRYPYEYEGGHIKGAKNMYTRDQILRELVENKEGTSKETPSANSPRNILIFHCEFSSERGPTLSRFLRNCDRDCNKESYPALYYPEIYILHGGYKAFFDAYQELCEPCSYKPMLDPKHETDLRQFRSKSKSWNGDCKSRLAYRNSLKRLGL